MIEFTLKVAHCRVAVEAMYESTRDYCAQYLSTDPADFSVSLTEADIAREREISSREARIEGRPEPDFGPELLEQTALLRAVTEKLFLHNTLLFHGSAIAVNGEGYLFTAKSGTGKSTHTRLWRQLFGKRAVMVNDDKPFLRITPAGVTVCGNPWNGKHGLGTDIQVPLKAICILERGRENEIREIPAAAALRMLLQQSSRPQDPALMPNYMELIDTLAKGVTFCRLLCRMDPEAAMVAYRRMSGKDLEL